MTELLKPRDVEMMKSNEAMLRLNDKDIEEVDQPSCRY